MTLTAWTPETDEAFRDREINRQAARANLAFHQLETLEHELEALIARWRARGVVDACDELEALLDGARFCSSHGRRIDGDQRCELCDAAAGRSGPLVVHCPTCGAKPGELCVLQSSPSLRPIARELGFCHDDRITAAAAWVPPKPTAP